MFWSHRSSFGFILGFSLGKVLYLKILQRADSFSALKFQVSVPRRLLKENCLPPIWNSVFLPYCHIRIMLKFTFFISPLLTKSFNLEYWHYILDTISDSWNTSMCNWSTQNSHHHKANRLEYKTHRTSLCGCCCTHGTYLLPRRCNICYISVQNLVVFTVCMPLTSSISKTMTKFLLSLQY